jgi:hypothetical protein
MQHTDGILPLFLNCDKAYEKLDANESPYIRSVGWDVNGNPNLGISTGNPTGEGQNLLKLTPTRSNLAIPDVLKPVGYNLNRGSFESETTQELYYFNYNSNGQHGIYIIDGNTLQWSTVIIDPELGFTDDPEGFIASHRVTLRATFDKDKNIIEKHLILTDGNGWQKFINVVAAIATNGFDATLFPYWSLRPPHFDRRELLEFAPRPPMYRPEVIEIQNTSADTGKINRVIDKSFQFAYDFLNTDGRCSKTLSPYSLPLIIKSEDFLNNPDNLPKKGRLTLYAGSCMTEKIRIYVRLCGGDWRLYDTIAKYSTCDDNAPNVIGNEYWKRVDPWADYNYDTNLNEIEYIFDYSKVAQIISQQDALRLYNDMPIRSVAQSDLGDAIGLGYNQYDYDNFSCEVLNTLSATVKERDTDTCDIPLRRVRLYAYVGREANNNSYESQVGYYVDNDDIIYFGSLGMGLGSVATFDIAESKFFKLNFADKKAFRCYLKGTPFYSDGKWFQVNSDNSLLALGEDLDFGSEDTLTFVQNVFIAGGYFVCVFDLIVPAGRYIATLGRHDVESGGDYRNKSTYIMGIANSRIKSTTPNTGDRTLTSIKPNAIVAYSKEMEIDCTAADVDVWGNNADLFYVYCPHYLTEGFFRFIEGYLYESDDNNLPVELFPYNAESTFGATAQNWGRFTDKNGFYFLYIDNVLGALSGTEFTVRLNCAYPTVFVSETNKNGNGWHPGNTTYIATHNGGVVGDCNRVLVRGKITNLDGTINYSNVAVSIKDGSTVYSRSDGTFELVTHNGQNTNRVSNIYVNAGGNFLMTISDCGQVPLFNFNEALAPCVNCNERVYPIPINLAVNIQGGSQRSLKENGTYTVVVYGGDLAGRLMYANPFEDVTVPSFLERNNTNPTYLQVGISSGFDLSDYPDIKWMAFGVSKNISLTRYLQWVGDNIKFIDNKGNIVTDAATAVFCAITIDSLYDYNISKNFSVLAKYQFVEGDRVRILDDGEGNLLTVANFGDPIDLQVLGTNYNQAAIRAGLLPPEANTVLPEQSQELTESVTLIVRYDSRLNELRDKTGFWIEIYQPAQASETIPYCEVEVFPVINGKIARFAGFLNGQPTYDYPATIDLDYWDTYQFSRNITIRDVGDKFFSHPFESPNISDDWGAGCGSCGRQHIANPEAKQRWFKDDVIKGDDFVSEGLINGLATFRGANRKNFKGYAWGGIIAIIQQRSIIAFICENDWFCTNYDFNYVFANAQGVQVANLDNKLSQPIQKIGGNYGLALEHTGTLIITNNFIFWYDYKNSAYVRFTYKGADDIGRIGMQSYFHSKTGFITSYNNTVGKQRRFDVIAGIDRERNNLYLTFRPRRNNSNNLQSYINNRRNWDLKHQETITYNIDTEKWVRSEGFAPEAYGNIKGKESGMEMIGFAAGKPYRFFGGSNKSFLNYFGQTVEPVVIGVFNKQPDIVKILQSISLDSTMTWFVDLLMTNEVNSYSYIPLNYFKKKENVFYSEVLRDLNTYPNPAPEELFRSMLLDGKRVFGLFALCRLVGNPNEPNTYRELKSVYYVLTQSGNIKK